MNHFWTSAKCCVLQVMMADVCSVEDTCCLWTNCLHLFSFKLSRFSAAKEVKGNRYTFKVGNSVNIVLPPF